MFKKTVHGEVHFGQKKQFRHSNVAVNKCRHLENLSSIFEFSWYYCTRNGPDLTLLVVAECLPTVARLEDSSSCHRSALYPPSGPDHSALTLKFVCPLSYHWEEISFFSSGYLFFFYMDAEGVVWWDCLSCCLLWHFLLLMQSSFMEWPLWYYYVLLISVGRS